MGGLSGRLRAWLKRAANAEEEKERSAHFESKWYATMCQGTNTWRPDSLQIMKVHRIDPPAVHEGVPN